LPLPGLETIYRDLWEPACGPGHSPHNEWLTLFLLLEEISEFNLNEWVRQDIRMLGERDTGSMHSYYYRDSVSPSGLTRENLMTLLNAHGCRTDFLAALPEQATSEMTLLESWPDSALGFAYLACRKLSRPLPWVALLHRLDETELRRFTRLARLKRIHALLSEKLEIDRPISAVGLLKAATELTRMLQQPEMAEIAALSHLPSPVKALTIVEGETEKLLLPLFAQSMGLDFNALGVCILPAGGKNHVLSLYRENARTLRIPICVVLDNDAQDIVDELNVDLRPEDYIFHIEQGEFEDMLDLDVMIRLVNQFYQPYPELTRESCLALAMENQVTGRVPLLKLIWQTYNLGSFDKIDFAGKYAEVFLDTPSEGSRDLGARDVQPPPAIRELVDIILQVRAGLGPEPGL